MSISLNTSSESDRSWAKFRTFKKKCLGDYEEVTVKNKSTCELGKGSYGSVRLVKDKSDNCLYAMKIVSFFKYLLSSHLFFLIRSPKRLFLSILQLKT